MNHEEKLIIERFATGEIGLRTQAIDIHREHCVTVGVRGNLHQQFMAEVDHPCPDLILRADYRERLRSQGYGN